MYIRTRRALAVGVSADRSEAVKKQCERTDISWEPVITRTGNSKIQTTGFQKLLKKVQSTLKKK